MKRVFYLIKAQFIFGFFFLLFLISPTKIYAAPYCNNASYLGNCYVDGRDGSDSNNGKTPTTAWKTIQQAANNLQAGDTVNVRGGITYTEDITTKANGSIGNYITYKGWLGMGIPIVESAGDIRQIFINNNYIIFSGFKLQNSINTDFVWPIFLTNRNHIIIKNNIIVGPAYIGIYGNNSTDISVYNNTLYNINYGGGGFGIQLDNIHTGDIIQNNLIVNSDTGSAACTSGECNYNFYWNNISNYYPTSIHGPNDITGSDPLFVDAPNGDFRLKKGSPAINSGTCISDVTTDMLGVSRPQGSGCDIGAYEYYDIPVSLTTYPNHEVNNLNLIFTGTASTLTGATIPSLQYQVDQGSWTSDGLTTSAGSSSNTTNFTLNLPKSVALSEGTHNIYFKATDSYTNTTDSSIYGQSSFNYDITAPDTTYTTSTDNSERVFETNTVEGSTGKGDSRVISTSNNLPTFTFVKTKDSQTDIDHYEVILTTANYTDITYISNIPPNKPGNGNKVEDNTREDEKMYVYYDQDTITVRLKKDENRLPDNRGYKVKIRAVDKAGNSTDTASKILLINSNSAIISGDNLFFPLSILNLGGTDTNISSLNTTSSVEGQTIHSTTPTIYGISPVNTMVTLTLYDQTGKTILTRTTQANQDSRYGINITKEDNLTPGTYTILLETVNDKGDYTRIPEFTLSVT